MDNLSREIGRRHGESPNLLDSGCLALERSFDYPFRGYQSTVEKVLLGKVFTRGGGGSIRNGAVRRGMAQRIMICDMPYRTVSHRVIS